MKNTCHIIRTCVTLCVPCMFENPLTSMMWLHPLLISLCRKDCAEAHVFDQCQFGAPWKKATKVVSWQCGHEFFLTKKCSGHKGICSRSHKPHIVLSGCSKQHGVLWTSLAQKYPPLLSKHIARKIIDQSTQFQLRQYFGSGQKPWHTGSPPFWISEGKGESLLFLLWYSSGFQPGPLESGSYGNSRLVRLLLFLSHVPGSI